MATADAEQQRSDRQDNSRRRHPRPWIRSVLVGADDSDDGRIALLQAAQIAEACSARLFVVDVMELPGESSGSIPFSSREQRERFERTLARLGTTGLEVELIPAIGRPGKALLNVANEQDVDLIVIGDHHLGRLHRLLTGGGTRSQLLRKAKRSVLIANAREHRSSRLGPGR